MQDGGAYSDILPIYFYCFLLLYALFWMVPRIGFGIPLLVSVAIYAVSQAFYQGGWFGLGSRFIVFDVAAWQFLFMIFLFIGSRSKEAAEVINHMPSRRYGVWVATLTVLMVVGRQTQFYPTPFAVPEGLAGNWPRMQLHPFFVVKIIVVCALFSFVILRPEGLLKWPNKLAKNYFTLPLLRNVGKYSIQMFTLHVFMMAAFKEVADSAPLQLRYAVAISLILVFIAAPNIWVVMKRRRAKQIEVLA